ncbi:putative MFS family arabinose efflux permease [Nocardiopsis sp. Huas11]|uniref:MFS transporter n=1 Tax=Nocardiopsis sp. Huas11 TaxID=2183912 RepID=UPI000F2C51A1|nr:MFS transporter [Nocardiopsis sp. Huas11]RKS09381.1 putative MFS family arabinose efflux permease [Nocardiopsis sp. Huas11]
MDHASYRRLFLAQVVALAGTGLATVALALLAYDLAADRAGQVVATALTIKMLAYVGAGPLLTAALSRAPRKAVLVGADIVRALAVACLPFVDQVWQVYVLIGVLQCASAAFTPTFQAIIPELVDDRGYTSALALSRLAYDLEAMAAPLLASLVLLLVPFGGLFALTALGFAASALLVATTALPEPSPGSRNPRRAAASWRAFATDRRLMALMALNTAVAVVTALVLVDTVVFVRSHLGGTDTGVALALACFGAGSMVVALALGTLVERFGTRALMLAGPVVLTAGAAAVALGWAWAPGPLLLGAGWAVLGAGCALVAAPTGRLLREAAPEGGLAGVFAAQFSLSHACFLLTYPSAGGAAGLDPVMVLAGAGVITGVCALVAALLWRPDAVAADRTARSR